MSWTDSTTIKKHLFDLERAVNNYQNVRIQLDASGKAELPHRAIVEGSDVVKRIASPDMNEASVALNGEIWSNLPHTEIIPDQIVVASDWKISTLYRTDEDFIADFPNGKVRRIAGGSIGDGATVKLFYQRFEVLTAGADYVLNRSTGEISLPISSSVVARSTLFVDYQTSALSGVEQLVDDAIKEAEDKILGRLKAEYGTGSTNQGLITGATELALAIICRGLASRALMDGQPAAHTRGKLWLESAREYEATAVMTLKPFLKSPVINSGGKSANQSWLWE